MTHISKHKLDQKVVRSIASRLASIIAQTNTKTAPAFLSHLLTDTEQVMLAKRLAVIAMFHEGCSTYAVIKTLKMSSSTAISMHQKFEDGVYDPMRAFLGKNKKEREELWAMIDLILRGGLPSRGKKDRWKFLNQLDYST